MTGSSKGRRPTSTRSQLPDSSDAPVRRDPVTRRSSTTPSRTRPTPATKKKATRRAAGDETAASKKSVRGRSSSEPAKGESDAPGTEPSVPPPLHAVSEGLSLDDLEETVISSRHRRDLLYTPPQSDTPACLVVISHPDSTMLGRNFEIPSGKPLIIGRSPEVEVMLQGIPAISRRHARIIRHGEDVVIEDLGSRNGTFLRGEFLRGPTVLRHGDQITIESVHIRFICGSNIEQAYHEAIYDLVMRDDLTQIYNRRKYENEVERDFARARRHQRALTLVLFDVDRFKEINDRYGHLAGDAVLQQIAALVSRHLRKEEVFARAGGDEFVVLCPEVGTAGGAILAERLRDSIAGHEFRRGDLTLQVTCSFGVAELSPEIGDPADLYAAADARLYAAKSAGRNVVA